jgi:hypothetical protein
VRWRAEIVLKIDIFKNQKSKIKNQKSKIKNQKSIDENLLCRE